MTGFLKNHKGQLYKLPSFLSWEIVHTDGEDGTDSFEVSAAYEKTMKEALENAVYFILEYEGETVFSGVVDEYEVSLSDVGFKVKIAGRGMGARLLDNRVLGAEYISCNLSTMLSKYVKPYGVEVGECDSMKPLYGYKVSVNESCMSALTGYTQYAGGVTPRFSKEGKLMLTKKKGERYKLDLGKAQSCTLNSRRYGVLSKVTVVTADGVKNTAENKEFLEKGGCASAVISVPRRTGRDAIRYTGAYQLEKSKRGSYALEVTVCELFPCFPKDVCVIDESFCEKGEYTVTETCCFGDENSFGTVLKLIKEDA